MSNIRERLLGTSNYNNTSNIRSRLGINEKNYSIREKLGVSERQNSNPSMKLFKKSSAFDDGYQFGDITSTILSTAGDLTANVGKGFLNTVEGVTDAGQYLLADAAKGLSKVKALDIWDKNARNWLKEKADALEENAKFDSTGALFGNNEKESDNLFKKGWSEELDKNSVSDTMVDSVAQGIGNVAAMAGTAYLGGQLLGTGSNATSFLNSFSSAFGNAKSEAYKNGADDKTALETATISGFAEAISEQFFDALPGMKVEGWGSKLTGKIGESVSKHFGTKAGKATLKVLDSVGEGAEEVISNALSAIGNDIVHYVDNDYNYGMEEQTGNIFKDTKNAIFSNDSLTSFISASLTSAIVNGGNTFITEKQKKSIITAYANDNNMSYEEAKKMFNSIVDINTNSQIDENTNFNDKIDLEEEETKKLLNSIKNGDVDLKNYVNSITSQINEYEALKKQNKLTSEQEIELNELKNRLSAIQNQSTDTSTSIKEEANLPTVQDIVNQEKSSQSGINLPVYNHQSNISNSDKAILPTVNDFSSSNTNMPTSDIKVDMAKISPEILNDIKGFKLGDPSIESYKGSYIKTMLNEVGIKVPTAMNYVSEVRPDMSFTTTKDLTRQQYASIGNALQKLRSVDVTSVNNVNYSIPIGNYQYVKSSNANINELRRTASMYLNNTARSNNTIKLLENIIKDRNYIIRFNPNITNEQGVPVNGLITKENGKTIIELNPNADNYVEFLVVHEITHDIATKEMKELILDYAKQDPEFEKSLESLKERYKTNDVSDEIVADVCGELFGNREFIQSVVEKKPNIFKKILNNIRKLAEKIKGTGANEYVNFVENLKEMWEEAYYSNKSNLKKTEYHTNSDIINNIDKVLNNIKERTPVRLRDYTPDILVQNGVKDLPMYENPSHIRKNILTENEARKLGLSINKNDHYHGLGKELYIKAIDSLDNPRVIFKRNNSNNYLILTTLKDNNGNNIVVPIEVETSTSVNNITIDVNRLKSVYGYERVNPNLDKYIKDNIKSSEFTKIYEQKKKPSTGKIPQSTSTANNIPQSSNNVNSNTSSATKYSIPINKNNTQKLDNSSFSFDNKGRKLSKEQQEYFKDSKARDENGNLKVVYHGTPFDFTQFSYNYVGTNGTALGKGFYLTDDIDMAKGFTKDGKEPMQLYVNITKPLSLDNKTISKQQFEKYIRAIGKTDEYYLTDYIDVDLVGFNQAVKAAVDGQYEYSDNDVDLIHGVLNTSTLDWEEGFRLLNEILGYDGVIKHYDNAIDAAKGPSNVYVALFPEQIKNVNNISPTINKDIRYSLPTKEWNDYLKENFPSSGTKTKMSDIKLPAREDIESSSKKSKILNPNEISKLTKEDANTTPILPKRGNVNKVNDGNSHFAKNIKDKVNMLNVEQKAEILSKEDVRYYDKVTNKESLEKAFKKINDGGSSETLRWVKQDSKNANATDVAEGWILLKQYADNGDYDSMVEVAKKMREIGTTAGQTVQAFNIMERMTPEGMVKYAQSELSEAYDRMVKNKSKEWIDKYREDFDLKPDEVKFIMDTMQEVQNMEDGYDKRVKLAEIQKLMTDKLPPEKGAKIRSWMRISMLFNPKTQVRNVAGNALIMPVNFFGDLFSSYADKLIAKKTGVRTTGTTNIKAMLKGIKKGAYEATNDYKKGINTKDMEGNRFEISDGKSFSEKNLMGRTLNRTESLLNYVMDVGDRVFSEAAFENSLQNQLVLNNTTEITQEMIDIAHQEALSRTWNDNNNYTRFVLGVRKGLNKLNVNGYGLGDVLIPFAKTPANLTKAIVDYSPAGLISTINKGINLKRSLANGQYTATMQHEFVQSLGKATAGTMLYILGIALAKAGITSGDSDDDKDTANFLKNTLGINSYSIKIGGKSFTYDWAQPLAAPLSITANVVNSKSSDSKALLEGIVGSLDSAGSILLEQSFLQSINDVLNDNDGVVSGIINEILELPARAVPTFSKQIADLVDGTQRTSFEYGKPIQSAVNSIKAKIPFVSKTLNPAVDTMGREIQKYGGKNNIFNVFLNPANVSTENISESAEEIYRLYKETGETDVMPRVAPYYINQKGEKIMMTGKDRVEYQKISGEIIEDNIKKLINNASYSNMSDSDKANVVKDIVNYSYNIAKKDVLGLELSNTYQKAYEYSEIGDIGDYYTFKESIDNTDKDTKKASITKFLIDSDLNNEQLAYLYGNYYSSDKVLNALVQSNIPIKEYIKFNSKTFESDYYANGKTVPNSRKNKVIKYINSLNLSISQKAMLIKMEYSSFKQYDNQIVKYVNNIDCSSYDKKVILKTIGFTSYDKDIINTINSKNISVEEKTKELEELGFKVRNGRVYTK